MRFFPLYGPLIHLVWISQVLVLKNRVKVQRKARFVRSHTQFVFLPQIKQNMCNAENVKLA